MKRTLRSIWSLTIASLKMYYRNKTGLFFTLFIPIMLVAVFGFLSSGNGNGSIKLNLTDNAHTAASQALVKAIKDVKAFDVSEEPSTAAHDKLGKGKLDLVVTIPENFGKPTAPTAGQQGSTAQPDTPEQASAGSVAPPGEEGDGVHSREGVPGGASGTPAVALQPAKILAEYNEGRPGSGQTAGLILGQIVSGFNNQITQTPQILSVETKGVKTNNLNYIDFLLPGIIAMAIMQLGIFSVAFAFVSYKTTGALRRLQATPTHPLHFIIGQTVTRLIISIAQVVILVWLGMQFFNFHLIGSPWAFIAVAILGSLVFLAFGFAIAGWAKDENQAAPFAQLIQFPMLFLSGAFFPRDGFPDWLKTITDYFPLTYLSEALRRIANEGASLMAVSGDLLGLAIWGVIVFFIAVRVFRWE